MNTHNLVFRYGAFAIVATLANLATQRLMLVMADGTTGFILALAAGTGVGLVVKFVLDKKWIFLDPIRSAKAETRQFSLYTLTGIGTTLIFWGTETAFWLIWQSQPLRELGAILGLGVGYVIKYRLDKRYVFGPRQSDV